MNDVAIIIISFNTKDLTLSCIRAAQVAINASPFKCKIIVVDNASKDGTCEEIQKNFDQMCLISLNENIGFGCAVNLAMDRFPSRYAFLVNSDLILSKESVVTFFHFLEDPKNSKVWACGGLLQTQDQRMQHSYCLFLPSTWSDLVLKLCKIISKIFGKDRPDGWLPSSNEPFTVALVTGANMFFRTHVEVGEVRFDPKFFMYSEDTELSYRMIKRGYHSKIIPTIQMVHIRGASSRNNRLHGLMRQMEVESRFIYIRSCFGRSVEVVDRIFHFLFYTLNQFGENADLNRSLALICLRKLTLEENVDFLNLKRGITPRHISSLD